MLVNLEKSYISIHISFQSSYVLESINFSSFCFYFHIYEFIFFAKLKFFSKAVIVVTQFTKELTIFRRNLNSIYDSAMLTLNYY